MVQDVRRLWDRLHKLAGLDRGHLSHSFRWLSLGYLLRDQFLFALWCLALFVSTIPLSHAASGQLGSASAQKSPDSESESEEFIAETT
jgi:hypothetical protein